MPEPITVPRHLPVRSASSVLACHPPSLNELWLRAGRRVREGATPAEAARSFLETALADPDRWLHAPARFPSGWNMSVETIGWKEGRRALHTAWCERLPASTTIPLAVGTLKVLRGEVSARGVLPPEACFEPMPFFEEMATYAREEDWDKPLLGESLAWLD